MKNIIKPVLFGALVSASSALAAPIVVTQFDTFSGLPTADTWYASDIEGAGTATIQNLTGAGGNLENNQPLPTGAAQLTTGGNNSDKAIVSTYANYGLASSVLSSINLSYSYYKTANGVEQAAAPSLKLTIYKANGLAAGTLIYEPYWNQGGTVPNDLWQSVSIDQNTGIGDPSSGGWWWNGGFNISSGVGGPPVNSLAEWLAAFQVSDPADFDTAVVGALSVGVGSYNPDQNDYFDGVHIQTGNIDKTYDFQAQSVPDDGSSIALLAFSFAGIVVSGIRRQVAKK